jgi:hypothetical protein
MRTRCCPSFEFFQDCPTISNVTPELRAHAAAQLPSHSRARVSVSRALLFVYYIVNLD